MIKENKQTRGFISKYGYVVDENGYLVHCEKRQPVIRLIKILRKKCNSYKSIFDKVKKEIRKKFAQYLVFKYLKKRKYNSTK